MNPKANNYASPNDLNNSSLNLLNKQNKIKKK